LLVLAVVGFASLFLIVLTYFLYFVLVYRRSGEVARYTNKILDLQKSGNDLPRLSIVVPTYNEAKVVRRKLENISGLDYPITESEVLVIDDCSSDTTCEIAEKALAEFNLSGKVLRKPRRSGVNESLNIAIREASNDLVCITDADVTLEKEALKNSVAVLNSFEGAAGVTGKIEPVFEKDGMAPKSESSYRNYYHQCMLAESCLHSAFPGNGPLIILNKSLIHSQIPAHYGSTDANIAMNIIRSGNRLLYVPNAVVYEPVPETVGQQRLQKVRRAKRLIQVFMRNIDVFLREKYGKFGSLIFPLKFSMHVVCPFLTFLSIFSILLSAVLSGSWLFEAALALILVCVCGALAISHRIRDFFFSFLFHQAYLLLGLVSSFRESSIWKVIERK
jgi:cellulose synthase/poly-beta-1,6-N-acetylglucosamine synthase-like glycosyltransferase